MENPTAEYFEFDGGLKKICFILLGVGLVLFLIGVFANMAYPTRIWTALLYNNYYFTAIGLLGMFYVTSQTVGYNGWFILIKRISEALSSVLLPGCIIFAIIFALGMDHIYEWTHIGPDHPDAIIEGKFPWLTKKVFWGFTIAYLILWPGLAYLVRKNSHEQDEGFTMGNYKASKKLSMIFLLVFGVSSSTAVWHWLMSIDPHWYSTLYGWYCFISVFVSSMAVTCIVAYALKSRGYLKYVTDEHFHDIGKWMFAFSVAWAYLWFSQFMLIWYSNIPEETLYFMDRFQNYKLLFYANFVINFIFPFLILMTAGNKRTVKLLVGMAFLIVCGHWLDFYLMTMPGAVKHAHIMKDGHQIFSFGIGFLEIGLLLTYLGGFGFIIFNSLTKASLVPIHHPFVKESMGHHVQ